VHGTFKIKEDASKRLKTKEDAIRHHIFKKELKIKDPVKLAEDGEVCKCVFKMEPVD
jgi:hypothetical protein